MMRKQSIFLGLIATSCSLWAVGCDKNEPAPAVPPAATKPDNTAINRLDRDTTASTMAKTPMDQSENAADLKISADIRRAVMDDKALSTNAQNAKIITNNGVVTLRGVVDTSAEKNSIETKAKAVAGVASVDNQITVKNP